MEIYKPRKMARNHFFPLPGRENEGGKKTRGIEFFLWSMIYIGECGTTSLTDGSDSLGFRLRAFLPTHTCMTSLATCELSVIHNIYILLRPVQYSIVTTYSYIYHAGKTRKS